MKVTIGQRLGSFEVSAVLGKGGMGEVWRAVDEKLGREVALKVLPEDFAADPDRHARFEREAKVLASLNHPNIATLHALEHLDNTHVLVMELVEGEGLDEVIARGPVPVDEAVQIALQIAEGVEAAHEAGIVHRDLKPANVRIRPDGTVKVLDFGLAKAWESDGGDSSLSMSPTMTRHATAAGVILGTAAYMSPEQARGKPVDRRADIWAFGVVLWEMLTGQKLFAGETVSDVLASVLKEAPSLDALPEDTPVALHRLLARCLEKDPKLRLQWIGDARLELADADEPNITSAPPAAVEAGRAPRLRERMAWIVAVAAVALAGALWWWPTPDADAPMSRVSVALGPDQKLSFLDLPIVALSQDGRILAFAATDLQQSKDLIFLRRLSEPDVWSLAGTERGSLPFFSPDGRHLGFFSDGRLMRIPVDGGSAVAVADAPTPRGAVWLEDNSIIFSPEYGSGLWRVPASGGTPELVIDVDAASGERSYRHVDVHPDGELILFTVGTLDSPNSYEDATIAAYSLEDGQRSVLVNGASMARFVGPETLVYWRDGTLFAVSFDPGRMATRGESVAVVDDVGGDPSSGAGYVATSTSGTIAWVTGSVTQTNALLTVVEPDGTAERLPLDPQGFHQPRFSPDGRRIAVTVGRGQYGVDGDVWVYSIATGAFNRLTFDGNNVYPLWSPDGRNIAYLDHSSDPGLSMKAADGSGSVEMLIEGADAPMFPESFSPDGQTLAFTRIGQAAEIYLITRGSEARLFEAQASGPTFSPDGRWIAYSSPGAGTSSVYVRSVEGDGKWQVSPGLGGYARWSGDGKRLYYIDIGSSRRPLMVVDVESGATFRSGPPRVAIEELGNRFVTAIAPAMNWDVAAMDERFAFVEFERAERSGSQVELAINWAQNLGLESP